MKQTEMDKTLQADPELDAELAQMAEEVPPMPADFHAAWMSAVRAEAAKNTPAPEKKGQKPVVSLTRWTRMLSIAAVFVFLIGGTILYRNSRKTLSGAVFMPEAKNAALKAEDAPAAETAAETEEAYEDSAAAPEEAMEEAMEEAAAAEEAEEVTALMLYDAGEETAGAALDAEQEAEPAMFGAAAGGAVTAEASEAAYEASEASEAPEAAYEAGEAYEAEEAAPMAHMKAAEVALTALPTAAPTMTPEPAADAEQREEAEEEPVEAPEAEEAGTNGGFIQEAGAFLTDMGDFLLAALPYLLVLAVPAAAALIIRRRKKK